MTREEAIKRLKEARFSIQPYQYINEVLDMAIKALEQKAKTGRWILTDVERDRIWSCNCSECGKDILDYIYGSEEWWLIYGNLPKFCPTCGSRNF